MVPTLIKVENACVGCGVILDDRDQRYCTPCRIDIDNGVPVDEFGRLMSPLMRSRIACLLRSDVDILDNNVHQTIRPNVLEDAEVKRLYHMYKSL